MNSPPISKSKPACPNCGAEISLDAPRGYCLKCLFALGIAAPVMESAAARQTDGKNAFEIGQHSFGDYELLEEIARGGMGVIYKARQKSLGRIVAVKMLLFGGHSGNEVAQRFRAEAAAAASLQHPNIVAIHEVGAHEGQPFFAMDFIEGQSLARLNAECELRNTDWLRRAVRYVKIVAEAIHYAHERGILHRDLKPSNILIDGFDQPRVTDFGLAKRLHQDSELTLSGQVLGSPNYMPPEQAAAKRGLVGRRSDVYSLGAILYHLLTGRPPFVGETLTDTLQAVVNIEPPSPRLLNPSVPPDLETLCLKCLQKDPGRRYPTAQALSEELDRFLRNEPIQARPVSHLEKVERWSRRNPVVASLSAVTVALLLVVAVGSPIAIYRIDHERKRAEKGEFDAREKTYGSDMNLARLAIAENDLGYAYELLNRHRPSQRELAPHNSASLPDLRGWEWRYLWQQCQGEERFILGTHTNGANAVGLLPDGKTVFSAGDNFVRLWNLESRRQIGLLRHTEEVTGAAASPDGRWLATVSRKYGEGQPVLLWDLATQKIETLTDEFWLRPGSITFSPNNKWLAFATVAGGIRIWDMKTRSEVADLPARTDDSPGPIGLAFAPDSGTMAYNQDEFGTILLWDVASHSLTNRLSGHQGFVTTLAFSPDGKTLVSGSDDRTARLWNIEDGRTVLQLTNRTGGVTKVAFFPDGRTLAISGAGGAGRIIRLFDVKTGGLKTELRGHRENISDLAITPDGATLLSASIDGTVRAWNTSPAAKQKSAHAFAPNSISSAWRSYGPALCLSPDGRHLLAVNTNQTFSVWDTLRVVEGERHPLPFTETTIAAVASGGKLAAFGSRSGEITLWDVELGQARFFVPPPDTNHVYRLVFSPDGRYLASGDDSKKPSQMSVSSSGLRRTLRVWDVAARKQTHAFTTGAEFPISMTFSVDARFLMAGFAKGAVKLWPLDAHGNAVTFRGHSGWVWGLAMLTNVQTFISAANDIRFWDVRARHENAPRLTARREDFGCIALSSDGRRLAAGTSDGRIVIWDAASHQEVLTLEGHEELVRHLAFTPDGNCLISVSKDQFRVWRAPSWAEIESAEKK